MVWATFIGVILVGLFSRYFSKGRVELLIESYRNAFHSLADDMEEKIQSGELLNDHQTLRLLETVQRAAETGFLDDMTIPMLIYVGETTPKAVKEEALRRPLPSWLKSYEDRRNLLLVEFLAKRHPFVTFGFLLSSPFLIPRKRPTVTRDELTQMAFSHA